MTFDKSRLANMHFVINSMNKLLTYYNEKMKIEPINKDATIATISVRTRSKTGC
ncbi:MAG: hypothetical protein IPP27_18880 [Bacteroidetes bacterium]|nr:hypothetical protein [Bacteroidota bacterium]